MNDLDFNSEMANNRLIENIKHIYNKLDTDPTFEIEDKFNIFRSFFEGLEIGLEIGIFSSGIQAYLSPPITVKIRFILTSVTDLGTKETWRLIGNQIKA